MSKRTEDLELYRVRDITLEKPFIFRLFSKGNIRLITSDHSSPDALLMAVPEADELMDLIRKHVEICRDRKRVREIGIERFNGQGSPGPKGLGFSWRQRGINGDSAALTAGGTARHAQIPAVPFSGRSGPGRGRLRALGSPEPGHFSWVH